MWIRFAFALFAGSLNAAQAQEPLGDPAAGRRLAQEVCTTCHFVARGERGTSPVDAPAFQDVADDPAATPISLRVFLRTPHENMPNLMFSEEETDDIIAYILSLR